MERMRTYFKAAVAGVAMALLGCSKTASAPEEIQGPSETIVLNMVDVSNKTVGALYIDNMNGKAQARIKMNEGSYTAGTNMKANITLTDGSTTTVYANCQDVSGKDGQCKTFPITVLNDNSDALFEKIARTDGIVFNVLDQNNNVYAKSKQHTIILHQ
jgi:hypothetical protein